MPGNCAGYCKRCFAPVKDIADLHVTSDPKGTPLWELPCGHRYPLGPVPLLSSPVCGSGLDRISAIDLAELHGMVAALCQLCGKYHLSDPASEEEWERTSAEYRKELSEAYPSVAKSRGWI